MDEVTKFCKNLTLLYVSNESSCNNTFEYFNELFNNVLLVDNYDVALKKFDESEIDIVITDIEINKEDGFSFIKELKNKNPKIITIIYTNNDEKTNFMKAISAGVNGYFLKPLDENDFLNTLGNLLQIEKEKKDRKILKIQYDTIVEENTIVSKTDKHGIITYVNDNFCKSSEYSKEELIGKSHNIVRHPDNPKELFKDLWQTIKVKKESWYGVLKNLTKSGKPYFIKTTIKPIFNVDGEIVEYVSIRSNINTIMSDKNQLIEKINTNGLYLLILA